MSAYTPYPPSPSKGERPRNFLPHTQHSTSYQQSNQAVLFSPATTDILILLGLVVRETNRADIAGDKAEFAAHGVPSIM